MGRPPSIDRDRVARAALSIIDRDGLDAISIDAIAKEVGVRGPTLYYHFADKAEILAEVGLRVLGDLEVDPEISDWREWMLQAALTFYRRVRDHPNAAAVLITSLPKRSALSGFAQAARLLHEDGIDPRLHLVLMEGAEKIAWGWAMQRAATTGGIERQVDAETDGRFSYLVTAARENVFGNDEEMLEASVMAFFSGILDNPNLLP